MKAFIENYVNIPGEHCGSTAMRNLISYYCDLPLSEPEVIGLGSAPDFIYMKGKDNDPKILIAGRGRTMEVDVTEALGIDYREAVDTDNQQAWEAVKLEVSEGRPTMLSGDTFYLDYRGFGGHHFPAHRFVLVGFDDERQKAIVADRIDCEFDECSYDALAASRNPPLPISTYNLWGKFHDTQVNRQLDDAYLFAINRTVQRMLGADKTNEQFIKLSTSQYDVEVTAGLDALSVLLNDFYSWQELDEREGILRYAANCIEKYGNGGGNFRRLYANFLASATKRLPGVIDSLCVELTIQAADHWTAFSAMLSELAKVNDEAHWKTCHQQISILLNKETQLFEHLEKRLKHAG